MGGPLSIKGQIFNQALPLLTLIVIGLGINSCSRESPKEKSGELSVMVNASLGGKNSQIAEWLSEELPEIGKELGVTVRFLPAGLNDQDFKARCALDIKAGKGADVIALDQFWTPEFANAGFIMPLDQYLPAWPGHEQFFGPIRQMGSYRGHTYQVIWNADVRMIFYNRELFARSGIEVPWQPESWDEIIEACLKIKAQSPTITPLQLNAGTAMGEATTMQGFYMVFRGAGGRLYDPDRECWVVGGPALKRTLEFYQRVYRDEGLGDPDLQVAAKAREKSFDRFSRGKIAVYIESTWFYTSVLNPSNKSWGIHDRDNKIGWAKMPGGGEPGDPKFVSISGGDGLIVNPGSKDPQMAWRLVMALNDLERQKRLFLKKPFTPTRKDLAELPEVKAYKFISETARELMPYTSFRPALPEYPEVSFQVQYLTERVATGQLGVDEAIEEFGKAVGNVVGKSKVCK